MTIQLSQGTYAVNRKLVDRLTALSRADRNWELGILARCISAATDVVTAPEINDIASIRQAFSAAEEKRRYQ